MVHGLEARLPSMEHRPSTGGEAHVDVHADHARKGSPGGRWAGEGLRQPQDQACRAGRSAPRAAGPEPLPRPRGHVSGAKFLFTVPQGPSQSLGTGMAPKQPSSIRQRVGEVTNSGPAHLVCFLCALTLQPRWKVKSGQLLPPQGLGFRFSLF